MVEIFHRYKIEEAVCDECHIEWCDNGLKKIEEEKNMRNVKGSIKSEFNVEWTKLYSAQHLKKLCFVFVADCGGDAIHICRKHLKMALELLDSKIGD